MHTGSSRPIRRPLTGSSAGTARRRPAIGALAVAMFTTVAVAAPLTAAHADDAAPPAAQNGSTGLPHGVPPAALQEEPTLPTPDAWGFSDDFPRTSGTSRLDDGALLWADWLYDDTGAGHYTYADSAAGANGADIFRAAVALDETHTHWRIDWNTLIDPDVPIAAWAFDTDSDPATGAAEWPANATVNSPGIDQALVVSSRGAWLIDPSTGAASDVTADGGTLTIDEDARSFIVSVPRTMLPVDGSWDVRLAAGVADDDGTGFAAAPGAPDGTRVYNAAFRDMADEPHLVGNNADASTEWNNGRQSERLSENDISDFSIAVDWDELASGTTTDEPMPTGFSTRWYVSSAELGQGMDPTARRSPGPGLLPATFWGRVQPYTVYVPTSYDPSTPAPLTLMLHGGNGNHNAFLSGRKDEIFVPLCEERGSICLSPLGRGLSTWYLDHGELDVWESWSRVAEDYTLDAARTTVTGFSMGGVGVVRLAANHPHAFAGAAIISGAGYFNTAGERDLPGSELRVENLAGLNTFINSGSNDIALGNTLRWDDAMESAGIPFRAHYYEGADHGSLGMWLGWSDTAEYLDDRVATVPGSFAFRWEPGDGRPDLGLPIDRAYWLTDLTHRDTEARWSRVTSESHALRTSELEPVLTEETRVIDGREVQVRDQVRVDGAPLPTENRVTVSAENTAALTVDLAAAGLSPSEAATIDITTDGDTELTWRQGDRSDTIELAAGEHSLVVDWAAPELEVTTAPHRPRPASSPGTIDVSASDASGIVSVDATVRDTAGRHIDEIAPDDAPQGEQTWSGALPLPDDLKPRRYDVEIRVTDALGWTSTTTTSITLTGR